MGFSNKKRSQSDPLIPHPPVQMMSFHQIILGLVIPFYLIELEIKNTKNTDMFSACLDLHLSIDSKERLETKRYDKRDDFNCLIANFPFTCSNIPAAPAYGVYITQLIRYLRAYGSFQVFLYRGLLLTRKLLNQWFPLVKLMSLLGKSYGRHHDLVDRYTKLGVTIDH